MYALSNNCTAMAGYQTACMHSAVMYCNGRISNCMHARSLINVSPRTRTRTRTRTRKRTRKRTRTRLKSLSVI
jgi:hypothetical protein